MLIRPNTRYYAEHIGCANTLADMGGVLRRIEGEGVMATDTPAKVDLILLHTCAFETAQAQRSLRRARELASCLPEDGMLLLLGCYGAIERDEAERLAEADPRIVLVPPQEIGRLAGTATAVAAGELRSVSREPGGLRIRISRGCANSCSFCAIPMAQGWVRSLSIEEIVELMRPEYAAGARQFSFASEDGGAWGVDRGQRLPDLLDAIAAHYPEAEVTVTTINPHWFERYREKLLASIRSGVLSPRIYCPAQSGSSRILRRMRRGYDRRTLDAVYRELISVSGVRLYQDLIVGHPGEEESDHRASLELLQRYPPHRLRLFAWRPRPGTRSASLPDRVDPERQTARLRELADAFLERWFAAHGYDRPGDRLRALLDPEVMPVHANIPLFGGGAATDEATSDDEAPPAQQQAGRILRLATVSSVATT